MTREFGKRHAEIMSFLSGLSEREKLVVLTYLGNDPAISARIPNLARTVLDMHRAHHRAELLKLVETEHHNLELAFLARRKGCRLVRATGVEDRWCILSTHDQSPRQRTTGCGLERNSLTRVQALQVLRSLPDREFYHGPARTAAMLIFPQPASGTCCIPAVLAWHLSNAGL